jgi:hypothetical protein
MRTGVLIISAVALAATLSACDGVSFKGGSAIDDGGGAAWPFVPEAMRVHPFTTIGPAGSGESMLLEVRMELLDQVGDPTKGVGDFRFELYKIAAGAAREGEDVRLFQWDAPMTTLEQNRRHYDPITRTYTFKLKLAEPVAPHQRLRLVVQYTDQRGHRLTAEAPMTYTPGAADLPAGRATS